MDERNSNHHLPLIPLRKFSKILTIALVLTAAYACQKLDAPGQGAQPLAFSSAGTKAGLSPLFNSFKVWTSLSNGSSTSTVMPGYLVKYDDTEGWSYTQGEGTEGQKLQYWDYTATEYRFHAGAPANKVSGISESLLSLDLSSGDDFGGTCLYSVPQVVKRSDPEFGEVVNLAFSYANARINLAFKYAPDEAAEFTEISLTPASPVATAASLSLNYDWERVSVTPGQLSISSSSSAALGFPDVIVPEGYGDAVASDKPLYMIPDPASRGQWTLKVKVNGVEYESVFTISNAWEAGKSYLYRFEYTDEARLVFSGSETVLFEGADLENGGEHNFS